MAGWQERSRALIDTQLPVPASSSYYPRSAVATASFRTCPVARSWANLNLLRQVQLLSIAHATSSAVGPFSLLGDAGMWRIRGPFRADRENESDVKYLSILFPFEC